MKNEKTPTVAIQNPISFILLSCFFLKSDGLRRKKRFEIILTVFDNLGLNTAQIVQLQVLLNSIKISDLKNLNIAQELLEERLSVITRFLKSAK